MMCNRTAVDRVTRGAESDDQVSLRIHALGPLQVLIEDQPVTHFESNKVRALLAYLAVEADKLHGREFMADMLWPNNTRSSGLGNLRYTISSLRKNLKERRRDSKKIKPAYINADREFLRFNIDKSVSVDVWDFAEIAEDNSPGLQYADCLEKAISLYRGDFLEGFSLPDSAVFEEWMLLKREQYRRMLLQCLHRLVEYFLSMNDHELAQKYAWKQVEMEPWLEEGYQQLMLALAYGGQRSAALAQFNTCRRLLKEELGIEPSHKTAAIYETIRDDTIHDTLDDLIQDEVTLPMSGGESYLQPIGVIHSSCMDGDRIPAWDERSTAYGVVEVFPEYAEGLEGIKGFSHLILLHRSSRSDGFQNQSNYLGDCSQHLYTSHYPDLSNHLGMSVVRLESRRENILVVSGVDVPDGTSLLDFKPYMLEFEIQKTLGDKTMKLRKVF